MKLYSIFGGILFLLGPTYAWAAPQSLCPEKTLDSGTVEGIYQGIECVDYCWAIIRLDNGDELALACDEDDAERFLGKINGRVSVDYDLKQFWNELGNECFRVEVLKSGRPIPVAK